MSKWADLHTHTTASDGLLSPAQLVTEAKRCRLDAIAITDHDTMAGCEEAAEWGQKLGIKIIRGIEVGCKLTGPKEREVHLLGYEADAGNPKLRAMLDKIILSRRERMELMIDKARMLGMDVTLTEIIAKAKKAPLGRPHLADLMIEKKYASSRQDAFNRFLTPGNPVYVPRYQPSPDETIKVLQQAGAVTFFAHPGISGTDLIAPLTEFGLQGVEVFHPNHTPKIIETITAAAQKLGLLMSGGTDFHCPGRIITHPGEISVPFEWVDKILEEAKKGYLKHKNECF